MGTKYVAQFVLSQQPSDFWEKLKSFMPDGREEVEITNSSHICEYLTIGLNQMGVGAVFVPLIDPLSDTLFIGVDVFEAFENNMGMDAIDFTLNMIAKTFSARSSNHGRIDI